MDVSRPWSDLPQGIVKLIANKLHFADQVCALAVCKNWQQCKDQVKCSDTLPWVMCHERVSEVNSDGRSFVCDLFDPYSRKSHRVSNSLNMDPNRCVVQTLASQHGWAWVNFSDIDSSSLFLHNLFTNEIRPISSMPFGYGDAVQATIKGSPTSSECEIFTLGLSGGELRIYTNKANIITSEFITKLPELEILYSVLYMKGKIYCLFMNGRLMTYNLGDKSWEFLTSEYPAPYGWCGYMEDCWLMEIDQKLIMVRLDGKGECVIFRFDWSEMSWVVETELYNCAIYISGSVAFSARLTNRYGEFLEECCRVFYIDMDKMKFKCYSWNWIEREWSETQPKEYDWISFHQEYTLSFIKPPYFGI